MNAAPRSLAVGLVLVLAAMVGLTGCKEFNARRKVNEAAKLYDKGRFREAAKLYEEALAESPGLEIAHFNAGLTYRQLFGQSQADPEVKEEEVQELANKAAEHFLAYLEKHPDDAQVVAMTTKLWLDSNQYKKALAYWEGRRAKDPRNVEVLGILASINRQAGDWETAVKYHHEQANAQPTIDGKASVLLDIAKIIWHKLSDREKLVGLERVRVADLGIAALQESEDALSKSTDPVDKKERLGHLRHKVDTESYLASMYEFRSLAHGAAWARGVDQASSQYHRGIWSPLYEEWKKLNAEIEAEENGSAPESASGGS